MHVFASREQRCHVYPHCELWLSNDGQEVAILPRFDVRGHFVVDDRDLHIDGKPVDTAAGIKRARRKLTQMSAAKVSLAGRET